MDRREVVGMHGCTRHATDVSEGNPVASQRKPDELVDDRDRQRLAGVLTHAAGAGLLSLSEVDERLAGAWQSRTVGDLDALTADLPASFLQGQRKAAHAAVHAAQAGAAWRSHLAAYLGVMLLLTVVWAVNGFGFPWPIYPALGWGIGLWRHGRAAGAFHWKGLQRLNA